MIFIEPGSKAYERMMRELPDLYERSRVMREVMRVRGEEIDRIIFIFDEIFNQFFIETATWHLKEYEEQFGLPVNESDSLSIRRKRVLAKKRSGRANLLSILQAEEPNLTLAWGPSILPFTIKTLAVDYDFGPLLFLLDRHAPAHLGYQFRIEHPTNSNVGYTVYMHRENRYRIRQQLLSGTAQAGRYPKSSTLGSSLYRNIGIKVANFTGNADLQKAAGLVSGAKDVQTSFGSVGRETINISSSRITGASEHYPSGKYRAGSIIHNPDGSTSLSQLNVQSAITSGTAVLFSCGTRSSGEEVA